MGFCTFDATDTGWSCVQCARPYDAVSAEYIARVRRMCPANTSARKIKAACRHRGDNVGVRECETCQGSTRIKLFACALHGTCTIGKRIDMLACCAQCADYSAARRDEDPDSGLSG